LLIAALCLLGPGCGDTLAPVLAKLSDPSAETRRAAARELGEHPNVDSRVIAALSKSLTNQDAEVRRLSAYALGMVGAPAKAALPALEKSLADGEPSIRIAAALAIEHIDPASKAFQPVVTAALRAGDGRVIREIGGMGEGAAWAVPELTALLSQEAPQVRSLAAQSLGRIGKPAASARVALQRATHDKNAAVQDAARQAVEKLPPP
jgi:HEAT repeat protein